MAVVVAVGVMVGVGVAVVVAVAVGVGVGVAGVVGVAGGVGVAGVVVVGVAVAVGVVVAVVVIMIILFSLTDQIPSGKNAIKEHYVRGKKIRYPNQRFVQWREAAGKEILQQKANWPTIVKMALPLKGDLAVTINYRPLDKRWRDVDGMQSALFHLLEHLELIEDDHHIKAVTWRYACRIDGPCIEMEIAQA